MMIENFTLNNGIKIPKLGMGGWAQKKEHILDALKAGYRLLDTAAQYGNEEEIGIAIRQSGICREDIFLTTKLWTQDIRQKRVRDAFEESLMRLGVDYVDEYYMGKDIFDDENSGYVFFSDYSWYDGTNYVELGENDKSGDVDASYIDKVNREINNTVKINDLTLKYDYFRKISN